MRREFTANVTHELKTPLTSISGYAEIIASGLVKPDDIPNFANKIHKESGRLLSLISDIMELSQLDEKFSDEEFAPVDLAGVAAEVAEDLRSNAEKHGITITVDTKTAVINGNRNQIYELIYNLCDNAIRYNRENGSVKIITGDDNEHPFVKVADTGIGIPEKHHKRVFERFYRVDKSRSKETGGTGLGLAIVKHITERHGGEISLESSEQGTTFTARFRCKYFLQSFAEKINYKRCCAYYIVQCRFFIAQTIQFHEFHIKNSVFRQISKIITKLSDFTNSLQFIDNPMTLV